MNQADADKMRTTLKKAARPSAAGEFACADCGMNATCPMLTEEVWGPISPRLNDLCNSCGNYHDRENPARHQWSGRNSSRDLLCLECAEKRLGRQLTLDDLFPCLGNYAQFTMQTRVIKELMEKLNPQWCPLCDNEVWSGEHAINCEAR